jgi:hypothetical protein
MNCSRCTDHELRTLRLAFNAGSAYLMEQDQIDTPVAGGTDDTPLPDSTKGFGISFFGSEVRSFRYAIAMRVDLMTLDGSRVLGATPTRIG